MTDSEPAYPDEIVSQFLAFTGSVDPSRALSYLEMSGGDLETAVGLFLEHENSTVDTASTHYASGTKARNSHSRSTPTNSSASASRSGILAGDGVRAPDQARRMRLLDFDDDNDDTNVDSGEISSGTAFYPTSNMMAGMMLDQRMRAMIGSSNLGDFVANSFAHDHGFDSSRVHSSFGSTTRFDVRDIVNRAAAAEALSGDDVEILDGYEDEDNEVDSDDDVQVFAPNAANTGPPRLSDMFAPPLHITYNGGAGFQGARNSAKDSKRWLLVNLQRDSDFACHALNRDVWRDELVENLIREGFVFWQSADTSPEGQIYSQRYKVAGFPHVAILDPRTGRLMWKKEGWTQMNPMTATMFAEIAADFCSRHSFEQPPSAPRILGSSFGDVSNAVTNNLSRPGKRPVDEMTEEQQLKAALRASMNDNKGLAEEDEMSFVRIQDQTSDNSNYASGGDHEYIPPISSEATHPDNENGKKEARLTTLEDEIATLDVGEEPSGNYGTAKIMFRMPDGKRLVRKFLSNDAVKKIYAHIAQSNDEAKNGKQFELKAGFPPKDLLSVIDDTIEGAGLSGDTVTVRWKV